MSTYKFTIVKIYYVTETVTSYNITEYLYAQNKGFVHLHVLFNIGFALKGKLSEVFRLSKPVTIYALFMTKVA